MVVQVPLPRERARRDPSVLLLDVPRCVFGVRGDGSSVPPTIDPSSENQSGTSVRRDCPLLSWVDGAYSGTGGGRGPPSENPLTADVTDEYRVGARDYPLLRSQGGEGSDADRNFSV